MFAALDSGIFSEDEEGRRKRKYTGRPEHSWLLNHHLAYAEAIC